jgi:hypothetical protein
LIVAYGRRIGIFGRLVNEQDRGIGNAEVQVLVQRANGERTGRATYKLRTRHDGTFRAVLRATVPSQVLAVAYRAHERVAKPTAEASLRLKVKAGLTLRARPGAVHNGQTISFWGRLLGGPIPREGRLLEVQVKHPWGWQTFATVRVRRHGTFRYRRRLRRSFEPITYVFRVRCRAENGYPYETGVSNAVAVRVV